ncbi:MAG: lipoate--protein ligase [Prolixibacteraceae bacterium]|jgi:lipoate---protein ligase|nr:lipoate--protein ligase [Prolixibacteraceae bacterium]MBT6004682.1 lipoate--protein ligase [Prolixibacteraceae bacterium]MBT6998560.1 lipoate--protein ligase [Prolixibacteraceae bacterium]MBT7395726.1 lipoate--protein ligase [Prolixibacteraceae bacterium]
MLIIHLENTDPYFCLAAEEFFLKNFVEDIFIIWQSENAIVVGKHQNALGEINYPFVRDNKITVARRISGGGTVFHDFGNVNFSFIKNVKSPAEISFKQFTEPVVAALSKLGVLAINSGRNDLLVSGKKISGNAEHVFKNRVLHHGTLLFNSDLKNLGDAIKVISGKYQSKAVQSNRSEVANISSFLKKNITVDEFIQFLLDVQLENDENIFYELNENDTQNIEVLVNEKFKTWQWNFGYSPKYLFKNEIEIEGKKLSIELNVKKGIIEDCNISGDYFSVEVAHHLQNLLQNKRHIFEDLKEIIKEIQDSFSDDLIYTFF